MIANKIQNYTYYSKVTFSAFYIVYLKDGFRLIYMPDFYT